MSHHWDTGFMVREPSWHKKERAVLANSPTNWADARDEAGLKFDVMTKPVYVEGPDGIENYPHLRQASSEWQAICRDDKEFSDPDYLLAIQKKSYQVITNGAFGEVIDTILGLDKDKLPTLEALFALYGGRMIVALCYFETPLVMPWDNSRNYRYLGFHSRHDGNGGLRVLATNVREQCANTVSWAEAIDGKRTGFTIRHTSNWKERMEEVSLVMQAAQGESEKWLKFAADLAAWKATPRSRDTFLKRFLPISDDMTERKSNNIVVAREKIREILKSPTAT